ncbi:jg24210 [Pararge aegeria aegeria]|uniref:Jg24210 protein n=1 Tax=Pararge aegeria aegeria TaxID=348720 RepID=A0A8S4RUL5_9NEOP|nr:jg24210 [Pararge aegeria aegeria]
MEIKNMANNSTNKNSKKNVKLNSWDEYYPPERHHKNKNANINKTTYQLMKSLYMTKLKVDEKYGIKFSDDVYLHENLSLTNKVWNTMKNEMQVSYFMKKRTLMKAAKDKTGHFAKIFRIQKGKKNRPTDPSEFNANPDATPDTKSGANLFASQDAERVAKSDTKPDANLYTEQDGELIVTPDGKLDNSSNANPEAKPDTNLDDQIVPKSEVPPFVNSDINPEGHLFIKFAPNVNYKPDTTTTPDNTTAPENNVVPDTTNSPESDTHPYTSPDADPDTSPYVKPDSHADAKLDTKTDSETEATLGATTEAMPDDKLGNKPGNKLDDMSGDRPANNQDAKPDEKTAPKLQPIKFPKKYAQPYPKPVVAKPKMRELTEKFLPEYEWYSMEYEREVGGPTRKPKASNMRNVQRCLKCRAFFKKHEIENYLFQYYHERPLPRNIPDVFYSGPIIQRCGCILEDCYCKGDILLPSKLIPIGNTVTGRAFHILAARIRNVDKKRFVRVDGISTTKDATALGFSLFCGKTGKDEQDCEVPEHTHRSISATRYSWNPVLYLRLLVCFKCLKRKEPEKNFAQRLNNNVKAEEYLFKQLEARGILQRRGAEFCPYRCIHYNLPLAKENDPFFVLKREVLTTHKPEPEPEAEPEPEPAQEPEPETEPVSEPEPAPEPEPEPKPEPIPEPAPVPVLPPALPAAAEEEEEEVEEEEEEEENAYDDGLYNDKWTQYPDVDESGEFILEDDLPVIYSKYIGVLCHIDGQGLMVDTYKEETQDPPLDDEYVRIIYIKDKSRWKDTCPCCALFEQYNLPKLDDDVCKDIAEETQKLSKRMKTCCRKFHRPVFAKRIEECDKKIEKITPPAGGEKQCMRKLLVKNLAPDSKSKGNTEKDLESSGINKNKFLAYDNNSRQITKTDLQSSSSSNSIDKNVTSSSSSTQYMKMILQSSNNIDEDLTFANGSKENAKTELQSKSYNTDKDLSPTNSYIKNKKMKQQSSSKIDKILTPEYSFRQNTKTDLHSSSNITDKDLTPVSSKLNRKIKPQSSNLIDKYLTPENSFIENAKRKLQPRRNSSERDLKSDNGSIQSIKTKLQYFDKIDKDLSLDNISIENKKTELPSSSNSTVQNQTHAKNSPIDIVENSKQLNNLKEAENASRSGTKLKVKKSFKIATSSVSNYIKNSALYLKEQSQIILIKNSIKSLKEKISKRKEIKDVKTFEKEMFSMKYSESTNSVAFNGTSYLFIYSFIIIYLETNSTFTHKNNIGFSIT